MRNAHDVGGMLGYGPVERGDDEVFHADWEKLAFGLTLASIANGFLHNVDENRYAKERMRPQDLAGCSYYELWLAALEMNLVENGVLTQEEISRREADIKAQAGNGLPEAAEPEAVSAAIDGMIAHGVDTAVPLDVPPRYQVGDVVVVDPANTRRHSRVPVYACGREARISAVLQAYPMPGVVAHEPGGEASWCYQVRFEAGALPGALRAHHRTRRGGRPTWLSGVLSPAVADLVGSWAACGGPDVAPLPPDLALRSFRPVPGLDQHRPRSVQ